MGPRLTGASPASYPVRSRNDCEHPLTAVPIERMPPGTSTADLLEQVAREKLDCALVESTRYTLARRFFPTLEVAFNLGKPVDYAWLVSMVDKKRILDAAGPFFERIRKDGTLKRLIDRHYGHALRFSAVDAGALLEQIAAQLPKLRAHFVEAEAASGVDWRLVAAIAYQESHWDPKATSPTGVRGLMMLTETRRVRLSEGSPGRARQHPGRRPLLRAPQEQLPPRIAEPDRTWLATRRLQHRHRPPRGRARAGAARQLNPDKCQDVPRYPKSRTRTPSSRCGTAMRGAAEAMQLVDNTSTTTTSSRAWSRAKARRRRPSSVFLESFAASR